MSVYGIHEVTCCHVSLSYGHLVLCTGNRLVKLTYSRAIGESEI